MENNELDDLEREERELLAQLAAKRQAKVELQEKIRLEQIEAARLEALNKPLTVTFVRVANTYVHVTNEPYNNEFLNIIKSIEGRIWKGMERVNAIPISQVSVLVEKLKILPNVVINYNPGVEQEIHNVLFEPDFSCDLKEKFFIVKAGRKAYTYDLRQIPGHDFDYNTHTHKIPLSEGWRLHEFAQKQEQFVWTEDAKAFVIEQVSNRLKLDAIAKMENVDIGDIEGLIAQLKGYQNVGIHFFDMNGGRGILGDEMGTGKTLQMIALALKKKWKTLVVCPAPLKFNWLREIWKFAPNATTYTCQGVSPTKFDIAEIISKKPDFVIINYDILGRSVEGVKKVYKDLNDKEVDESEFGKPGIRIIETEFVKYPWVELMNLVSQLGFMDLCVMDEGHYIKNLDSNRSKAARKLTMPRSISMTGTPVVNRPGELWPMLHIADPITFPSFELFKRQYTVDGSVVRNVEQLKQLLRPLMIRRLKKDVIKELEPINRINSYFELSSKGRKLYDRVLSGLFTVLAEYNPNAAGQERSIPNLLVQIQRLKQVVAIDAVESTADLATEILDNSPEEGPENKVLIFSQFKATTYAIAKRLGHEALSFVSLSSGKEFVTGDARVQQQMIDQFQNDKTIKFLCVTEKTAKEGHNITAARAVIFNDLFWTPAGHQQAEARAYGRVSDLHTIDAYYRIGVDSISEKIMEILARKLSIIEQVVEGVEASRADTSIIHDLLSSLKEEMWSIKKKKE